MISAQLFDTFDRCSRRLALERTHEPRSISTTGLLYAGIEGGIVSPDPLNASLDAIRALTASYDVEAGPLAAISAVRHVGYMAQVIALALVRRFGVMRPLEPVDFVGEKWKPAVFETRKGDLHRIVLISYLDDDALRGFAHAWGTVGELAALGRPLTLTFVSIGAQRGGRRHSYWTKGLRHPQQKTSLRFARRKGGKGSGFTEGWVDCWRERTDIPATAWLDRMQSDGVLDELIQSRTIPYRADDRRIEQAKMDLVRILPRMKTASVDDPMSRSACDDLIKGPCCWQNFCWSPISISLAELAHLYRKRVP